MIENAAVFVNGMRQFKGVNVETTDDEVIVKNRVTGVEMARYSVVNVAKAVGVEYGKTMAAWDIPFTATSSQEEPNPTEGLGSLVVQQGCGCSGMLPYMTDDGYDGPFKRARR